MSFATLNGNRLQSARIALPLHGNWVADVTLDAAAELSGRVTLVVADLSLEGTIVRGGEHKGASSYRIEGGAGGWRRVIPAQHFRNDGGVKASKVLAALASKVGETFSGELPSTVLGTSFVREAATAAQILSQVVGTDGWYVANDGTTVVGQRPAAATTASFDVISFAPHTGILVIATETPGLVAPGCILSKGLDAPVTASDVVVVLEAAKLRMRVQSQRGAARWLDSFRALAREAVPTTFFGTYQYRVVSQAADRITMQPVRKGIGLPDEAAIDVRPGLPGMKSTLVPGCRVLVSFIDGDAAQPYVHAFEPAGSSGFLPVTVSIDATDTVAIGETASDVELAAAEARVIRSGDKVAVSGPADPTTGIAMGIITLHPSVVSDGPGPGGWSRVKA